MFQFCKSVLDTQYFFRYLLKLIGTASRNTINKPSDLRLIRLVDKLGDLSSENICWVSFNLHNLVDQLLCPAKLELFDSVGLICTLQDGICHNTDYSNAQNATNPTLGHIDELCVHVSDES